MVKRYDIEVAEIASKYHAELVPVEHPQGDYVKWSDYAALAERCERLEAALRKSLEWVPEVASASARRLLSEKKEPNT